MLRKTPPWFLPTALTAALLLAACGPSKTDTLQGYVEGEFLYLAAPQAGYLQQLDAPRGTRVEAGQTLFTLATDPDRQALAEAEARSGVAKEKLENLKEPRRETEIATLEAQRRAAQAALTLADTQLAQQQALAAKRFVSQSALDQAKARRDEAAANLEAAKQQIASYQATLGREAEVRGAQAELAAATALAEQKRWQVDKKTGQAPAAGEVADTYFRPGEWVPAGQPVASLLPDERRRIRFFVPETLLSRLQPGQKIEASCDGCSAPITATIDFIAPDAEYTPPVIYSQGSREKLVFRVEAKPSPEQARQLRPGLPVDVKLP